jgi:dienelactone hydrolase
MKTQNIEYQDGDVTLRGFVAFDDQTSHRRPGVLVMPEAFGLGVHAKQRAERLAALGYVALAGDPYGNGVEYKDLQEAIKYAGALREDPAKFRKRARVALDKLASLPQVDASRLAAIGYCMGGTFALELARADEMTKAGADWQIISYGGTVHSFTNPDADSVGMPGLAYNKLSDERSWKAMASFFEEIFGAA